MDRWSALHHFFTGDDAVDLGELEEIKLLIDQKIENLKGGKQ